MPDFTKKHFHDITTTSNSNGDIPGVSANGISNGLYPFVDKHHKTWFGLEPISGRIVHGSRRLQTNVKLDRKLLSSPQWDHLFQCKTPPAGPGLPMTDCIPAIF